MIAAAAAAVRPQRQLLKIVIRIPITRAITARRIHTGTRGSAASPEMIGRVGAGWSDDGRTGAASPVGDGFGPDSRSTYHSVTEPVRIQESALAPGLSTRRARGTTLR
jgi:hypothetical protein